MEDEDPLSAALGRLPQKERPAWIKEANRLACIVEQYASLRPKRRRHPLTGHYEFVTDALALCRQAACRDPVILGREPHRARPPSPQTLDDWQRAFRRDGLLTFLRCLSTQPAGKSDRRRAKLSPERWRKLYEQHQRLKPERRATGSPFIRLETYREALAGYISTYNSAAHERTALGSALIVPLEAYRRLYTTRFEIAPETLALLLMKAEKRVVRKNGIQCFQKHWFYWHDALSIYKGQSVEVRYSDGDYSRIRVVLPGGQMCEAQLITPTSLLNPNKQTLSAVAQARARERKLIRDFQLLNQSALNGETTEDRVAHTVGEVQPEMPEVQETEPVPQASVHLLMRPDHRRMHSAGGASEVNVAEVTQVEADLAIFDAPARYSMREFDFDE